MNILDKNFINKFDILHNKKNQLLAVLVGIWIRMLILIYANSKNNYWFNSKQNDCLTKNVPT